MGFLWQETHRVEAPEIPQFPSTTVDPTVAYVVLGKKGVGFPTYHVFWEVFSRVTFSKGKIQNLKKSELREGNPSRSVFKWGEMWWHPYKLGELNPSVTH